MEIMTIESLKEVIVSQAAELADVRRELANEKSLSKMWLDLKCKESETLEKVRAEYDGLEELYDKRGDRIKELEARLQRREEQTETVHLEIEEGQA